MSNNKVSEKNPKMKKSLLIVSIIVLVLSFIVVEKHLPPQAARIARQIKSVGKLVCTELFGTDQLTMHFAALDQVLTKSEQGNADSVLQVGTRERKKILLTPGKRFFKN